MSQEEISDKTAIESFDITFVEDESTLVEGNSVKTVKNRVEFKKININNTIEEIIKEHNLIDGKKLLKLKNSYSSYMNDVLDNDSINNTRFYSLLSKKMNLPFYEKLRSLEAKMLLINRDIVSDTLLKNLNIIIFKDTKREDIVELVISNPYDYEVIDYIQNRTTAKVKISLAQAHDIKKSLKKIKSSEEYKATISSEHQGGFTKKDLHVFDDEKSELPVIEFVQFVVLST
jgi:hypothetical protein